MATEKSPTKKLYVCDKCGKEYHTKARLRAHSVIHEKHKNEASKWERAGGILIGLQLIFSPLFMFLVIPVGIIMVWNGETGKGLALIMGSVFLSFVMVMLGMAMYFM